MTAPPNLAGCGRLVRLILRRDRFRLTVWLVSIPVLVYAQAASIEGLYSAEDLAAAARLVEGNAAFIAMSGPPLGLETIGGRLTFEIAAFAMILAALMNLFMATRHLRAEEESGRTELVRAAAVGLDAPLAALLVVALVVDTVLAALIALSLVPFDLPASGVWALSVGIAGFGLVFATVGALASQLTMSTRAASGLAGAALAVAYVVRGIGDIGTGTVSWLSPMGWAQALRPFAGERWWVVLLILGGSALLAAGAAWVHRHRDLGSGIVQPAAGPDEAAPGLGTPAGLAWRLLRGTIIGWSIGLFLGGLAYGSVGGDVEDFVGDNEVIADIIAQEGGDLVDSYLATTSLVLALTTGGFAVQGSLRLRSEEVAGRVEPVLATAVSRGRWAGGHLAVVVAGTAAVLVASGLGTGISFALVAGGAGDVSRLVGAALVYLPALLVLVGLAVALLGLAPRLTGVLWGLLVLFGVVGFLGEALNLPELVADLSPFQHVPRVPAVPLDMIPLLLLGGVAAALLAVGGAGLGRRDIPT